MAAKDILHQPETEQLFRAIVSLIIMRSARLFSKIYVPSRSCGTWLSG